MEDLKKFENNNNNKKPPQTEEEKKALRERVNARRKKLKEKKKKKRKKKKKMKKKIQIMKYSNMPQTMKKRGQLNKKRLNTRENPLCTSGLKPILKKN